MNAYFGCPCIPDPLWLPYPSGLAPPSSTPTSSPPTPTETNFWLIWGSYPESDSDTLLISQDGTVPGCVQADSARDSGPYPPGSYFSGPACGVNLNFYQQSNGQYIYYQANGDGTPLGICSPNQQSSVSCLQFDGMLDTFAGEYSCQNYSDEVNGVNPCT
jgi:hypothetical protein